MILVNMAVLHTESVIKSYLLESAEVEATKTSTV